MFCARILAGGSWRGVLLILGVSFAWMGNSVSGSDFDTLGVTLLRTVDSRLTGQGVRVAQVEAPYGTASPPYAFEVNPAATGQPTNFFTYYSALGTATAFTNTVGLESGHADGVAGFYYGLSSGVATQVVHVDNYEADYFYNDLSPSGRRRQSRPASSTKASSSLVRSSLLTKTTMITPTPGAPFSSPASEMVPQPSLTFPPRPHATMASASGFTAQTPLRVRPRMACAANQT